MLVPLDPSKGFRPVPKKDREEWLKREKGFAGKEYDPKTVKTDGSPKPDATKGK